MLLACLRLLFAGAVLAAPEEASAQSSQKAEVPGSSEAETAGRFYAGLGMHVSQSIARYQAYAPSFEPTYDGPGMSLSLDLEFQGRSFLVGGSLQLGSWVRTEPPFLGSLHAWGAVILGSGEIAPYIGAGFGALALGEDEKRKAGPAANATVGLLFFRSRRYLRPELTLQVWLPTFDTSNTLFNAQAPAFWPVALVGIRLLI